jgi:hypothetical protein
MMATKRLAQSIALLAVVSAWTAPVRAQLSDPQIGGTAPAFALPDVAGNEHSLESYRGKWVVLEWLNYGCPYVGKHYNSGNMPALQTKYRDLGVVWLSVVSSARGQQGYYEADEMSAMNEEKGNEATAVLLDPEGVVGRAYGARTTPQMVVIDPAGTLRYNGAIDDKPTTRLSDIEGAHNYLAAALDEAMAGKEVSQPRTQPYGCGVKYNR